MYNKYEINAQQFCNNFERLSVTEVYLLLLPDYDKGLHRNIKRGHENQCSTLQYRAFGTC